MHGTAAAGARFPLACTNLHAIARAGIYRTQTRAGIYYYYQGGGKPRPYPTTKERSKSYRVWAGFAPLWFVCYLYH
jgi:hypothetical protein